MQKTDNTKDRLLEMIGICGEFPADQLNRLIPSSSYAEKVITELKSEKLIRTHYRNQLRGYRLTKQAKELLLSRRPARFHCYLTGNSETNRIRSEAVTLRSLPLFYSSREVKELGAETTKIKNSRSVGILMAEHCVYALYNTGDHILKWEYKTEVRVNAFLQHYLQGIPYAGRPPIHAIMLGTNMDIAFQLLTSTGGYKKSLFILDTSFEHFHYVPNDSYGEGLFKLLTNPQMMERLNRLLLSDQDGQNSEIPIEHDAVAGDGPPTLLAYDFDMQRINRFNTGLNVYGLSGNLICFDFQIPCLKEYLTAYIRFSSIDFSKFQRGFYHEP